MLGSLSPLAAPIGSGASHYEDVYRALRSAVGSGVSPENGLDDIWRQARAVAIAAGHLALDRAALQALPVSATDHLDAHERLLGLSSSAATTEQDRRDRVVRAWTRTIRSTARGLELDLQAIAAAFSLFAPDRDKADTVQFGRIMPPEGTEATFGTTQYPNYSTSYAITILYAVPAGDTGIPGAVLDESRDLLNDTIPGWVDFVLSQEGGSGAGFYADGGPDGTSVADLTAIYD